MNVKRNVIKCILYTYSSLPDFARGKAEPGTGDFDSVFSVGIFSGVDNPSIVKAEPGTGL